LFLALFVLASTAAATNIITNGSFDAAGTQVGGFTSACSQTSASVNCPFLASWTVQTTPAAAPQNPGLGNNAQIDCLVPGSAQGFAQNSTPTPLCTPGNPPSTAITRNGQPAGNLFTLWSAPGASPDGGNYFLVDGGTQFSGVLQQTVTGLHVGSIYNLSFWMATGQEDCLYDDLSNCDPNGGANLTQNFQVTFGSTTLTTPTFTTVPHTSNPWTKEFMQFVPTSITQTLTFFAKGTPDIAPPVLFLDGVDLEQAPEASTSALMGLGLVGGILGRAVLRNRRKRKQRAAESPQPPV
jgi:hypothetical protein